MIFEHAMRWSRGCFRTVAWVATPITLLHVLLDAGSPRMGTLWGVMTGAVLMTLSAMKRELQRDRIIEEQQEALMRAAQVAKEQQSVLREIWAERTCHST